MSLAFTPLEGAAFGVLGPDLDLAEIDDQAFGAIKKAVQRHGLVLFRRQALGDAELDRLSARFGQLEVPANLRALSPVTRHVVYISNLKDEAGRAIGGGASAEMHWHADQAFRAKPATLSLLYAVVVPPSGGHTYWCSTRLGFSSLPEPLKAEARGLRGTYLPSKSHEVKKIEVAHPLVLTKPDDGVECLFVSQSTRAIEGVAAERAETLLAELLDHQLRPGHIYEHDWRPGDLAIYDNGQTLHRRDAFAGLRFMKGTRAFVSPTEFAVPD
jgi:taurine dioxygenase